MLELGRREVGDHCNNMYVDMYTQECPHMFNIVQQSMYNDVSNIITYTFLIGHGYLLHYY